MRNRGRENMIAVRGWPCVLLGAIGLACASGALAAECRAVSPPGTATLVELYTSEGCSDCPPAESWLSGLSTRHDARVVPISFHVQFWDSLGWNDRFADERFTNRQQAEVQLLGTRFVYTPEVVVAGREFTGWRSEERFAKAVDTIAHRRQRAQLEIDAHFDASGALAGSVATTLVPGLPTARLALVVAAVQDGLTSRVTAGENRGAHLTHDSVARDIAVFPVDAGRSVRAFSFSPRIEWDPKRVSVTAFLQDLSTGEVVQALAATACS
jgi:hypothetical protein